MSVHNKKKDGSGSWFSRFRKGKHPTNPEKTREYFGPGEVNRLKAEAWDKRHIQVKDSSGLCFYDLSLAYMSAKKNAIEGRSVATARDHLRVHLTPFFGQDDPYHITPERLDAYVNMRASAQWKHGKAWKVGVRKTTIIRELTTLHAVLNFAARRGLITHNPAQFHEKPKEDTEEIVPPTPAEWNMIYLHSAPHLKRFLMLAYFTAARPGEKEILRFRWEQVDFINGTIYIVSARKNGPKRRVVKLHPTLLKNLEAWHNEDSVLTPPPANIVHYRGKPIKKVLKAWNNAKKRAKVLRKLTPYSNRHRSITEMLEQGGDLKSVAAVAGHSNPAMTMKRYQHASDRLKEEAVLGLPDVGVTQGNTNEEPQASES